MLFDFSGDKIPQLDDTGSELPELDQPNVPFYDANDPNDYNTLIDSRTCKDHLDPSFNEEFDLERLDKSKQTTDRVFTVYENTLTYPESELHNRPGSQYYLHLNKIKHKRFVKATGDFAGFVYEGECSPSELLTPRHLSDSKVVHAEESKEKTQNVLSQLDTQSTIDEEDTTRRSGQTEGEYGPEKILVTQQPEPSAEVGEKLLSETRQLEFLISSIDLCKKIDKWSEDIKSSLCSAIVD